MAKGPRARQQGQLSEAGRHDLHALDTLLEFYIYPAEHWIHLRTTPSSPPLPPCDCISASPRAQDHAPAESP